LLAHKCELFFAHAQSFVCRYNEHGVKIVALFCQRAFYDIRRTGRIFVLGNENENEKEGKQESFPGVLADELLLCLAVESCPGLGDVGVELGQGVYCPVVDL
jgi:hypothetical protein